MPAKKIPPIPADVIDRVLERIREVSARFGVKSSLVVSAQGGSCCHHARKRLIYELLMPPYILSVPQIAVVLGYYHSAQVSDILINMGYGKPSFGPPPLWKRPPMEVVESLGGFPGERTPNAVQKKMVIVRTVMAECPGISLKEFSKMLGKHHSTILRYVTDEAYEKSTAKMRERWHANNPRSRKYSKDRSSRRQDDVAKLPSRKPELRLPSFTRSRKVSEQLHAIAEANDRKASDA